MQVIEVLDFVANEVDGWGVGGLLVGDRICLYVRDHQDVLVGLLPDSLRLLLHYLRGVYLNIVRSEPPTRFYLFAHLNNGLEGKSDSNNWALNPARTLERS